MRELPEIYLGRTEDNRPGTKLKAGVIQCCYKDGILRAIMVGGTEVLRMVFPAVRNRDWLSIPGRIMDEEIDQEEDSFRIRCRCQYSDEGIEFMADYLIEGTADHHLKFTMEGEVLCDFLKNRIGLNILHPLQECRGKPCQVRTSSGEKYHSVFPGLISPYQPMKDIASLNWEPADDLSAILKLSGDVFEMEDHRNWTDASFKIYSTPLDLPFPVRVRKGEKMRQEMELRIILQGNINTGEAMSGSEKDIKGKSGKVMINEGTTGRELSVKVCDEPPGILPEIGICRSSDIEKMLPEDMRLIRDAGFNHYRIDLELSRPGWESLLEHACAEAKSMGMKTETALFFPVGNETVNANLIPALEKQRDCIGRLILFTADHLCSDSLNRKIIPKLRLSFPGVEIGTGTNANFAELNRNPPGMEMADFISYAISPQIHASDDLSVIENLEAQPDTVSTAKSLSNGKPVLISPVTLKPRFNVVATSTDRDNHMNSEGTLPDRFDQRQSSLFCAGWTLGSLKYLSESGVSSITYYESAGRGGIIHGGQPPVSADLFPAKKGDIYPVYFLFRELKKFRPAWVMKTTASESQLFSSLYLDTDHGKILILANHSGDRISVRLPDSMEFSDSMSIDEYSIGRLIEGKDLWMDTPAVNMTELNPYAVKFIKISL